LEPVTAGMGDGTLSRPQPSVVYTPMLGYRLDAANGRVVGG